MQDRTKRRLGRTILGITGGLALIEILAWTNIHAERRKRAYLDGRLFNVTEGRGDAIVFIPGLGVVLTTKPRASFQVSRSYDGPTNILRTTFTTARGRVQLTDLMPVGGRRFVRWQAIIGSSMSMRSCKPRSRLRVARLR